MDQVRDVCSAALSVRKAHGLRVRLPLASLTVAAPDAERAARRSLDIVADEVNVKEVDAAPTDVASVARHVLQVVPAALGPRLGGETQHVIRAVQGGRLVTRRRHRHGWRAPAGARRVRADAWSPPTSARSTALGGGTGVVVLDTSSVTPELEAEGQARDLVRLVQQARRDADLAVSDRIVLRIAADERWAEVVRTHEALIAGETLAVALDVDDSGTDTPEISVTVAS